MQTTVTLTDYCMPKACKVVTFDLKHNLKMTRIVSDLVLPVFLLTILSLQ